MNKHYLLLVAKRKFTHQLPPRVKRKTAATWQNLICSTVFKPGAECHTGSYTSEETGLPPVANSITYFPFSQRKLI